ncbi:hypothetical protein EYF80_032518 [Liparis tanakae]|uniref:Uncharacterized protein n=1 Tax=Liparis tanakae TaxID=230148 RepID=A0A4Z2GUZ0_9TELE|nr:hypothetical protein EYF80_032518 [Liparis tanakae]
MAQIQLQSQHRSLQTKARGTSSGSTMHVTRSIRRREHIFFFFFFFFDAAELANARRVCAAMSPQYRRLVAPPWTSGLHAPPRAAAERRLHGRRAETSRCGSADNSCALTGDQRAENGRKWRREPRDKEHGWEALKRTETSLNKRDCTDPISRWSRSPAAATGLWSFVCAPFIHHLCFPGNRGLPAACRLHQNTAPPRTRRGPCCNWT